MGSVRHPNITLFLGACIKQPKLCIVLEYCENGSLWNVLHFTNTELPWKIRKKFALDISKGVNYLHSFTPPIIHRDIKSLNVLLDHKMTCKLTDFGWARIKEAEMTGKIGTFQWMAPEVICCNSYSEKADVFSFGIIMWEIAVRKPPYYGMDAKEVANRVVYEGMRPFIKDTDASAGWISLMKRCWVRA
jgi:serine/threonine protein kinase